MLVHYKLCPRFDVLTRMPKKIFVVERVLKDSVLVFYLLIFVEPRINEFFVDCSQLTSPVTNCTGRLPPPAVNVCSRQLSVRVLSLTQKPVENSICNKNNAKSRRHILIPRSILTSTYYNTPSYSFATDFAKTETFADPHDPPTPFITPILPPGGAGGT